MKEGARNAGVVRVVWDVAGTVGEGRGGRGGVMVWRTKSGMFCSAFTLETRHTRSNNEMGTSDIDTEIFARTLFNRGQRRVSASGGEEGGGGGDAATQVVSCWGCGRTTKPGSSRARRYLSRTFDSSQLRE